MTADLISLIANPREFRHSLCVPKGMERRNSRTQRLIRTRQHCGFFAPGHEALAGRATDTRPRKGEEVRSTAFEFLTSRPPCRLRVETLRQGLPRLTQERFMSHPASLAIGALAPVLAVINGIPTTSSQEIARVFGKRHDNVMQAIQSLLPQLPASTHLNFQVSDYADSTGRRLPAYRLTRDGFTLLAMGFTGKKALTFKLAYIDAFNAMEAKLHAPALNAPAPAPMDERIAQAIALAGAVATKAAQTVFEDVLKDEHPASHRWVFNWNRGYDGRPDTAWAKAISDDAIIAPLCKLPSMLADAAGTFPTTEDLVAISHACLLRLARRRGVAQ